MRDRQTDRQRKRGETGRECERLRESGDTERERCERERERERYEREIEREIERERERERFRERSRLLISMCSNGSKLLVNGFLCVCRAGKIDFFLVS